MAKYDCTDVSCPKCLAPVGIPCVTITGRFYRYAHVARQGLSRRPARDDERFDEEMEKEGATT